MASALAADIILPLSSQKHDPAWKHCHMIKRGDRIHLKCMYCHKLFSGGGIHRIKEHLACQKGNASSCPKVNMEVRRAMQQSLEGVVMRRKKKQKLAEEVKKLNHVKPDDIADAQSEADMTMQMVAMPDSVEPEAVQLERREELAPRSQERKRKRKNLSPPSKETVNGDQVCLAIARFLFEAEVPLDAVNSPYFQPMIDAIAAAGPGLKAPSYHDLRGWILKNSLQEIKSSADFYKETWTRTGCSILADEWTTEGSQTLINFSIYSPGGITFLKSVEASQMVTSPDALYELLKLVVEEVGVANVLQIITNNTETHAMAGKRLTEVYPSIFWTPCASRCVDAMLEDISKLEPARTILEHSKSITRFVYNNSEALNMVRRFTGGKELVKPGKTPSETSFETLKSMAALKENLTNLVISEEWKNKSKDSAAIADLVCSSGFWSSMESLVQLTDPLLQISKMASSPKRPAMGFIHGAFLRAKKMIKRALKRKKDYSPYWNIIDWRWQNELPRPLQMAGFFFNPKFFYSIKGEFPNEIMPGVFDCIERLVPEMKSQDRINKELMAYKNAAGDFGRKMAIRARDSLLPGEWWSTYGGGCPNLARLAIRVLSQTCSARGCERSHVACEQLHGQRNNLLEHQRLGDLIYVRYNLRLQQRHLLKNTQRDPLSVDPASGVEEWTVERDGVYGRDEDESSWMELIPPTSSSDMANEDDVIIAGIDDECFDTEDSVKDDHDDHDGGDDDEYDGGKDDEEIDIRQDMYGFVKEEE